MGAETLMQPEQLTREDMNPQEVICWAEQYLCQRTSELYPLTGTMPVMQRPGTTTRQRPARTKEQWTRDVLASRLTVLTNHYKGDHRIWGLSRADRIFAAYAAPIWLEWLRQYREDAINR